MMDYFKDICDWKSEDDNWRPQTYLEVDDYINLSGKDFLYHYEERDWWVLGYTKEENLEKGRCCVMVLLEKPYLIAWDSSFAEVQKKVQRTYQLYLIREHMKNEKY